MGGKQWAKLSGTPESIKKKPIEWTKTNYTKVFDDLCNRTNYLLLHKRSDLLKIFGAHIKPYIFGIGKRELPTTNGCFYPKTPAVSCWATFSGAEQIYIQVQRSTHSRVNYINICQASHKCFCCEGLNDLWRDCKIIWKAVTCVNQGVPTATIKATRTKRR